MPNERKQREKRKRQQDEEKAFCDEWATSRQNERRRQTSLSKFFPLHGRSSQTVRSGVFTSSRAPQKLERQQCLDSAFTRPTNEDLTRRSHVQISGAGTVKQRPGESTEDKPKVRKNCERTKAAQLYLDFGQQSFGKHSVCPICGMLFVHGVSKDLVAHQQICQSFLRGIPFRGTKSARTHMPTTRNKENKDMMIEVRRQNFYLER